MITKVVGLAHGGRGMAKEQDKAMQKTLITHQGVAGEREQEALCIWLPEDISFQGFFSS